MVLGGLKAAFVPSSPRDLGVRGASIVRCGLSCLCFVDLNWDLYRLCGSLHGPDTANPTWGDIFESSKLKARTSLLPRLSEKRRSNFEL